MTDLRATLQATLGSAYSIERELSGGGMSRVFVAEEQALGRKVVVKVLPPDTMAGVNLERFRREILVSAKLQHPHIVPVLATGEIAGGGTSPGVPYYTMPFVEGESLRGRLARSDALPITEVVSILKDVARALAFAHEHNVAHRDIKPDNILLSGGSATVADFGIAKAVSAARDDSRGETLTQMGTSLGTPAYMAPEQAAADPSTDHRADIYSFGCVAYELLAGRPPFIEKTPQRLLAAQMSERPRPVLELRPDTPPPLADLVAKCLEKSADERPQRAAEIVRILETVTSGGGHPALPPILLGGAGMFRRALMYYAAAFIAVLVVAQAAVIAVGLPDWAVPGATVVMLLGLPVILFTGYVQRVTRRAVTMTPAYTPGGTPSMPRGTMASLAIKASPHVSWHRTAKGGMIAVGAFVLLVAVFMILRAKGIGPAGSLLAAGKLVERDPLLLTEFRVVQADSTLGAVLSQAVRSNLEQSSAITLVPRATVTAALERMQKPRDAALDISLAQQLAVREGIKAIVDGEVAGIGAGYLLTLRLVTADSGRELASFREGADSPRELIDAVDRVSRKMRGRIGESLRDVHASPSLAHVTTQSIDALRKYTEATKATGNSDWPKAAMLAREAIALDSNFALAWRHLGESMYNAGIRGASLDSILTRAFEMRDRLAERERLAVEGDFYSLGPGRDRAKAVAAFERQIELGDYSNSNSLSELLVSRREFARAESLAELRIRAEPRYALSYGNRAVYQLRQGKLGAADSTVNLLRKLFPQRQTTPYYQGWVEIARGDMRRAVAVLDSFQRAIGGDYGARALRLMAGVAQTQGRSREHDRLLRQSRSIDSLRGVTVPTVSDSLPAIARSITYFGPTPELVARIESFASRYPTSLAVARAFAYANQPVRARAVLAAYRVAVKDTVTLRVDEPAMHLALGELALAEDRPLDALREFRLGDQMPDGPASSCNACLYADLARAYDRANMPDSTIAALEQTLTLLWRVPFSSLTPLLGPFEKRLGELFENRNELDKAHRHYSRFVELWQSADPELQPRVAEVRDRLRRITERERRNR
jgi:eukaryotic-like serine/threonine-protein kinase